MLTPLIVRREGGSLDTSRALVKAHVASQSDGNAHRSILTDVWSNLRSRYFFKVLDYLVTADIDASAGQTAEAGSRSHKRALRAIHSFRTMAPGATRRIRRALLEPLALPFAPGSVDVLGFGSTATVFLLPPPRSDDRPRVLKVYRRSLGCQIPVLLQQARVRQSTYQRVCSWYSGLGIVLPTHHLILQGPLLGLPVVACMQRYVAGSLRDVFRDLSEEQLVAVLRAQPRLAAQFRMFVERTLNAAEAEDACVDIVGPGNLVIVNRDHELRLLLIDLGVYDFERKRKRSPRAFGVMQQRLEYLRRVSRRV